MINFMQTAQGTMLISLQAFMALNQLKQAQQQQLAAAAAASVAGGVANSPDVSATSQQSSGRGEKEVHQVDGLPPDLPTLCHINKGDKEERDFKNRVLSFEPVSKNTSEEQLMLSSLEPQILVSHSNSKVCDMGAQCDSKSSPPNLEQQLMDLSSKSHPHRGKCGKKPSNAEFIIQVDGPISDTRQRSKDIVQLDGGGGGGGDNGSSSEDDSDGDEDSSEVSH